MKQEKKRLRALFSCHFQYVELRLEVSIDSSTTLTESITFTGDRTVWRYHGIRGLKRLGAIRL